MSEQNIFVPIYSYNKSLILNLFRLYDVMEKLVFYFKEYKKYW